MAEKNIDVAYESTCQEILRVVNESGGDNSIIKKIQFGNGTIGYDESTASVTLRGFTNTEKMVVILNGSRIYKPTNSNTYQTCATVYLQSLTASKLTIGCKGNVSSSSGVATYSYQVIEFN